MNNLKEKIEKALDKCDVVVVSGVSGVGKSTLLKEIAKERHIHYSNPTYNCIKFSIKHSDLIAIDDVRETELKNVIQKIQDAVAKTNIKTKAIIVVDKFDKSVLDSVVLKIKHYRMVKPKSKGVLPKIKEYQELLKSIEEQRFLTDNVQISCLNDLYQMEQELKYLRDLNEKYECEAVLHDHNYTQLALDLDDSKAKVEELETEIVELKALMNEYDSIYHNKRSKLEEENEHILNQLRQDNIKNEELIKENYSLHLKIKELNDILYDQNEEKIELEGSNQELEQSLSQYLNKIRTYQNTVAVFEDKTRLLEKANNDLECEIDYLNEKVHCLKEELDNEAEETAFFKEMSEDFITQIKWLNNTIEVYRGEVDEDTIRRVEYTVQQLRESFGDDYEV
ncbi:AAA family ATPase [Salmonella enterica]|uniref:AAA family ATPase n=1 Tax=Salmonella enterica TaxID=28901 RepID=UPI00265BF956|nr:AAA family ATPase [Salmonella enterica]MDO1209917.1 AAA family ATPase [Salmonella enterica subsp. enterica serovar Bredeney]MDO1237841.1 AAA family ATPase [Salmonella enterica subsp. enterica serovar Bredeney]MDO1242770.1 AAA family ATPase [Salmonella enterica subsp. enterica serovar Bredeney]MDO1279153.1 AAA family ATPase [Salmonella enterica subsp. enterica serovar Bredeney]MDO1284152.1 AAA family ATPase [Salmonella enterica subsp. enterica serovar Bredeney]